MAPPRALPTAMPERTWRQLLTDSGASPQHKDDIATIVAAVEDERNRYRDAARSAEQELERTRESLRNVDNDLLAKVTALNKAIGDLEQEKKNSAGFADELRAARDTIQKMGADARDFIDKIKRLEKAADDAAQAEKRGTDAVAALRREATDQASTASAALELVSRLIAERTKLGGQVDHLARAASAAAAHKGKEAPRG